MTAPPRGPIDSLFRFLRTAIRWRKASLPVDRPEARVRVEGWARFSLHGPALDRPLAPLQAVDAAGKFLPAQSAALPTFDASHSTAIGRVPDGTAALRLDPALARGCSDLIRVDITELGRLQAGGSLAVALLRKSGCNRTGFASLLWNARNAWRAGGWGGVKHWLAGAFQVEREQTSYDRWRLEFGTLTDDARSRLRERIASAARHPLITVHLATAGSRLARFRACVESVRAQLYPTWELCVAADAATPADVAALAHRYAADDARIRLAAPGSGDFTLFLHADDLLAEDALHHVADAVDPGTDFIYSDEDRIDEHGLHCLPNFKPDWNPDLLLAQNYVGRLAAFRTSLVRGSDDWDRALYVTGRILPSRIRHIPRVLYHRRLDSQVRDADAERRVLAAHLKLRGIDATPEPAGGGWRLRRALPAPRPGVSIIVLTRDRLDLLRPCIESLRTRTSYRPFEILIVDNGSSDAKTLAYLGAFRGVDGVRVIRDDRPFNYAALMNRAVRAVSQPLVAMVNNDVEVISPDWLDEMVSHAVRPEVGAVGCMLYYPDGTIQHGGVILGIQGGACHAYARRARGHGGYGGRALATQNLSAVTGACLVMRRAAYEEVAGMDEEHLAVAYNDVDLCLRLRAAGTSIVWTPHAEMMHHESASRGRNKHPEAQRRELREVEYLRTRWGDSVQVDPAYNPNLAVDREPFELAFPPRTCMRCQ
jgi:GT2 family glycosyltransferase